MSSGSIFTGASRTKAITLRGHPRKAMVTRRAGRCHAVATNIEWPVLKIGPRHPSWTMTPASGLDQHAASCKHTDETTHGEGKPTLRRQCSFTALAAEMAPCFPLPPSTR